MKVLLVHAEAKYFAGAEKMLLYYLREFDRADVEITIAVVEGSKLAGLIPPHFNVVFLRDNQRFSLRVFGSQLKTLSKACRSQKIDLLHGWAARDWELCGALGLAIGVPAIGTLHDHPHANFISPKRQVLMRTVASHGLRKVICVSEAVCSACRGAGYPADKLAVIRNGLPIPPQIRTMEKKSRANPFQIGFLGAFTERKGLRTFFDALDALDKMTAIRWAASIAGGAHDPAGEELIRQIRNNYEKAQWWPRIQWVGWVERPDEFLNSLDLLIVPSSEFDPFPTVLLEAGFASLPVIASDVGGVGEIIKDGETGWLFEPNRADKAAILLKNAIESPVLARAAGECARRRVEEHFSVGKMIAGYCGIYASSLIGQCSSP